MNQGVGFQLWAGDPLRLPDAAPASFCLGWSASLSRQAARLSQWRQNALPLRQAAAVHGLELRCDGDARGDWLIATGPAERLDALVELAVACWPETVTRPRDEAPKGLLAQRMLTRLVTLPPPGTPGQQSRQPLAWVHGDTDTQAAEALLRRLAARRREDDTSYEVPAELHWLSAQADDHAAMLEIAGPDDTPAAAGCCSYWPSVTMPPFITKCASGVASAMSRRYATAKRRATHGWATWCSHQAQAWTRYARPSANS